MASGRSSIPIIPSPTLIIFYTNCPQTKHESSKQTMHKENDSKQRLEPQEHVDVNISSVSINNINKREKSFISTLLAIKNVLAERQTTGHITRMLRFCCL